MEEEYVCKDTTNGSIYQEISALSRKNDTPVGKGVGVSICQQEEGRTSTGNSIEEYLAVTPFAFQAH
jgi:hypothetical protein